MKIKALSIILIAVLYAVLPVDAIRILNLNSGMEQEWGSVPEPLKNVVQDQHSVSVTYEVDAVMVEPSRDYEDCVVFSLEGFGINDVPGEYAYLKNADCFLVPRGT